ncbi:hypothetical protein [Azospirillum sp. sgz302134]
MENKNHSRLFTVELFYGCAPAPEKNSEKESETITAMSDAIMAATETHGVVMIEVKSKGRR